MARQPRGVEHHVRDVLGLEHAVELLLRQRDRPVAQDRRRDLARADDHRADAVDAFRHVELVAHRDHAVLGGGVAGPGEQAHPAPRARRGVDEDAVALRAHRRQDGVRAVHRAGQVGVDHQPDRLRVEVLPRAVGHVEPGVVHEDVDPARLGEDLGRDAVWLLAAREVARLRRRRAARRRDAPRHVLERRRAPAGEDDARARRREAQRGRLADAAPRPRDPDHLAREIRHVPLPPRAWRAGGIITRRRPPCRARRAWPGRAPRRRA